MNLEKRLEELQKEIDGIKKELLCVKVNVKPQFTKDQYVFWSGIVPGVGRIVETCPSFPLDSMKVDFIEKRNYKPSCNVSLLRLATPEEVEEALVKEAKKKGIVKGVRINQEECKINKWGAAYDKLLTTTEYKYEPKTDTLFLGDYRIYWCGIWAEIIAKPKVMIGDKYEVVKAGSEEYQIESVIYTENDLRNIADIFKVFGSQIKSLNVGCRGQYKVDLNKINEILAM